MMKSLEIIKDLEEQVKLVPMLKVIFLTETTINIAVKAVVGVEIDFNELIEQQHVLCNFKRTND